MPAINRFRPAAVYAPDLPGSQDALLPVLTARRLYVLDRRTETLGDLQKPVLSRPVLRLHMLHAAMGPEWGAAVFVTDSFATLGDEVARVAVVGALMQVGCEVVVDDQNVDARWYQRRVHDLGYSAVGPTIDRLLNFTDDAQQLWGAWAAADMKRITVLPTSLDLRYDDARLRVKELTEFDGLTVAQIADRLAAEGHLNAGRRHVWYPKAVRVALEQGL
jgi:hypothetical protein